MEQCAYISASRMRGPHCLTASMDSITFERATRVGDILYLTSQVMAAGWWGDPTKTLQRKEHLARCHLLCWQADTHSVFFRR